MRVYDLPEQILPHIAYGLNLKAHQNAGETLAVVDELWLDDHYEARDLAAHLLGQVPFSAKADVFDRIKQWSSVPMDMAVVGSVFSKGSQRLRSEDPKGWAEFVGNLLASPLERQQNHGLLRFRYWWSNRTRTNFHSFFAGSDPSCKAIRH